MGKIIIIIINFPSLRGVAAANVKTNGYGREINQTRLRRSKMGKKIALVPLSRVAFNPVAVTVERLKSLVVGGGE